MAGALERRYDEQGRESLRVTDAGIAILAKAFATNRAARSAHEGLVEQVAHSMTASGRLAWRGLMLRVPLPVALFEPGPKLDADDPDGCHGDTLGTKGRADAAPPPVPDALPLSLMNDADEEGALAPGQVWAMACPDVFSVRRTSVEAYLEPVVHEIKVSRADLLSDLKNPAKRAAYLAMASACWYVIGCNAKRKPIAEPEEIPVECGVMLFDEGGLRVLREAPRRGVERLPFSTWMALAKASPVVPPETGQMTF